MSRLKKRLGAEELKEQLCSFCNKLKANKIAKIILFGVILLLISQTDGIIPSFIQDIILIYIEKKLKI